MLKIKDPTKRTLTVRLCIILAIGAALLLMLILPLRGIMNAVSRFDFIAQRLDDYPRMYANYIQETEDWWNWWMTEDYGKRAEQALFIYNSDETHSSDAQKLAHIAEILGADEARVVTTDKYDSFLEENTAKGWSTCFAQIDTGRRLVLSFHSNKRENRMAFVEDEDYFLSQLQAGLPGYVVVLHDGEYSIYPRDNNKDAILQMIRGMLDSGKMNPEALRQVAQSRGTKTALKTTLSSRTELLPGAEYFLYSAAYADTSDLVVSVSRVDTLVRFGRKRSWSLWFLCCAVMILLVKCLWNTKLYQPGTDPAEERVNAVKNSISAMFLTGLLVLVSVIVIQMLSGVNLSQQGATDQTVFLKQVLGQESERAATIIKEFDTMYSTRAATAASVLSENPNLIEVDSLNSLDRALDGTGLRVFDTDGNLLASDEVMHQAVDESMAGLGTRSVIIPGNGTEEELPTRYYRAALQNEDGKTSGWVELCVEQAALDELLKDTILREVVRDLHTLDTLHIVVVKGNEDGRIVAGTWDNWVGDSAAEHGIRSELLYDGYEGIVNFEGNKCYSTVFSYDGNYVIVGSEDVSLLVFAGGVMILFVLLFLVLFLLVYRPAVRLFCAYQKKELSADAGTGAYTARSEYPPLGEFLRDFMVAVFLLSAALYFITKGDPAGLTYNIVRGTWIRGVNAATITTCIMLVSVVFAIQRLMDMFLLKLGKYLSPKGMTICRLVDSLLTYGGAIVMIIYALSMFGVNTATLIGGVGLTALLFTFGANSLLADVVSGVFIIFEGDFTVGDVVVIDDFRGIVTDIGIRTTKLMDDNTRDIKIVNNNSISNLVNQSREKSAVIIDIPISRSIGLERGEQILTEGIAALPAQFPQIIGDVDYWGVSKLPSKNAYTGKLGGATARIAFDCKEQDKEMLTYQVYRTLVELVNELAGASEPAKADTGATEPAKPDTNAAGASAGVEEKT